MLRRETNNTCQGGEKLNYMEVKQLIERQQLHNKKGKLTEGEIKLLVKDWHDQRTEKNLNQVMVEMDMHAMEKTLSLYNMEQLGDIPINQEDAVMKILVCHMGGLTSKEVREFKIAATKQLIKKYNINV